LLVAAVRTEVPTPENAANSDEIRRRMSAVDRLVRDKSAIPIVSRDRRDPTSGNVERCLAIPKTVGRVGVRRPAILRVDEQRQLIQRVVPKFYHTRVDLSSERRVQRAENREASPSPLSRRGRIV